MTEPRTVLIVDDDQSFRRVMEYQLREDGYRVLVAASAADALLHFKTGVIDVVLTDVRMPGADGMDLLAKLKATHPELPVIMLTAHGTIGAAVDAIKGGAFDYLTKPFTREQLRITLGKTLDVAALKRENRRLRDVVAERFSFANMVAESRAMHQVCEIAARVAQTDATVLLEGESGTGKELFAKAIHFHSERKEHALIIVNCAAIPENLLESELFGHRRGSFTGALTDKQGKFEAAHQGTIFLDEIGDLPPVMQTKLLRVLQDHQVDKVGDVRPATVDIRVVAATNRNLEQMVADGDFREDLYYRLAVVAIRMPALRERTDDIPVLVEHFLAKYSASLGRPIATVSPDVFSLFNLYAWPGNIRELENVVQRALVLDRDNVIGLDDLPDRLRARQPQLAGLRMELPDSGLSLEDVERELLLAALVKHDWNQTRTATYLNISRSALIYRMQKFALARPGASLAPE
jgi:two-component system NtrC family response regulator